ncbi:ribosome biogenesis/translation initiation ATPase RLI [Candidatus Woesearchaeota archaeon]|nr:ribosome biogenesis/translation initiation ATPase RLI [Candidatus Woesearchaeota archaeon]
MTKKVAAIVERNKCHPDKCQHECIKYDPINRSGKGEGFHIGPHGKAEIFDEVVSEIHRISANKCPFEAIHIVKLPQKLENPLHKYGQNAFELYSLPLIKENTIVGIIGRNGIGKSTALNILSGNLKPNLGNFKGESEEENILNYFAKTHLKDYFRKLFDKKIKVAYKPQRVELIPSMYKGSVINLLEKHDDKKLADELLKELDLSEIKNHDISKISGGELQRVAIIASLIKDSDVIYLDEPASFLDITYRIKVAKLIREFAKNTSTLVVEHDLATLDYISDEIQIAYGEHACYGVFSQSKGVRRGINEYLDGYLPDENIRFRDYKIDFSIPQIQALKSEVLASFPGFEKSYEKFRLKVNEAEFKKSQVLAVMGSNGLGKTTFLKILAGIESPDNTKIEPLSISYKPQYIEVIDGTIEEHLRKVSGSLFDSGWYQQNILEKLNLKPIMKNEINFLSGGELQKFYVALTLSRDSKIMAFDEPSAFIDTEDRLKVAEVIKEFTQKKEVSTVVVDHDIQFIDYIADSMLVFEGIPSKEGNVYGPLTKKDGMNKVLKNLGITYRKDKTTFRPRINKPQSQVDEQQKKNEEYYLVS